LQTIYFRTRGGDRQGWGNVIRLLSIYNFFSKKFKCLFIYEGNENVRRYIDKLNINSLKLKTNIKVFEEKKVIDKLKKSDFSIMEMLNCNFLRQKIYKDKSKKLIVIDDILKKKYCSDIVICGQKKYTKFSNLNLKSGYKYFPLRDDFKKFLKKKKKIKKNIRKITVILGGGKYKVAYIKIINFFKNTNYNITVILGMENNDLYNLYNNKYKNIHLVKTEYNLSRKLFYSDLVICGGGYTKVETAYLKTPMIVFPVQKHQISLCQDFFKYTKIKYLPLPTKLQIKTLKSIISEYDYIKRLKIFKILMAKFKSNNFEKIISKIVLKKK
jgi:spore coat polysaccharide biosynthesis predicted glycosyltransferase SpsG